VTCALVLVLVQEEKLQELQLGEVLVVVQVQKGSPSQLLPLPVVPPSEPVQCSPLLPC
jgi:hypothetical protein